MTLRRGFQDRVSRARRESPFVVFVSIAVWLAPTGLHGQQVARATGSMVVTQHRLATDAGIEMLEAGGNAVDAAVAAAFAAGVVDPQNSGIGGRTQIVIRTPEGETFAIDGTTQFPAAWDPTSIPPRPAAELAMERRTGRLFGYDMVGIPGTVAALASALARFGAFGLPEVLAPSIRYADEGVVLERGILPPFDAPAEFYGLPGAPLSLFRPNGSGYQPGDLYRQPELAKTLRDIAADGSDVFYRGRIAQRIAEDMAAHGGLVTLDDLAQYEAQPGQVVRGTYRGHTITGSFWPASGATVIQSLQTLERLAPSRTPDAAWIANITRAMRLAVGDRPAGADAGPDGARWLTSDSLASRRAAEISALPGLAPLSPGPAEVIPGHTTHLVVVDDAGWAVSLTQSLGDSFGSRVMTDGLGFLYASAMGYQRDQGALGRPGSNQSPMVVDSAGQVRYVIGSAGSDRIISSIVLTLDRVLTFGQSLGAAVAAARVHPVGGGELRLESRGDVSWASEIVERLEVAGWNTARDEGPYGILHGIAWDTASLEWVGVADPRGNGTARGLAPRAPAPSR